MSPSTSHCVVPVEQIGCSASVDGVHHTRQDFPFPGESCVSGLFESDPGMFGYSTQTVLWGDLPSQQAWTSVPTQLVQNTASPSVQDNSDRGTSNFDGHGNNLLSCSGISDSLNVAPTVTDAMTGAGFTMTCPIPHCCFQCRAVLDMWRHVTWTHVRPNSKESGIESIVERVVLGGLP